MNLATKLKRLRNCYGDTVKIYKKRYFLGLFPYNSSDGYLWIDKYSVKEGYTVSWVTDADSHNPIERNAYSIDVKMDGTVCSPCQCALSWHIVPETHKLADKIKKALTVKIKRAYKRLKDRQ